MGGTHQCRSCLQIKVSFWTLVARVENVHVCMGNAYMGKMARHGCWKLGMGPILWPNYGRPQSDDQWRPLLLWWNIHPTLPSKPAAVEVHTNMYPQIEHIPMVPWVWVGGWVQPCGLCPSLDPVLANTIQQWPALGRAGWVRLSSLISPTDGDLCSTDMPCIATDTHQHTHKEKKSLQEGFMNYAHIVLSQQITSSHQWFHI